MLYKFNPVYAKLYYDKGTIKVEGDVHIPHASFDQREGCYRSLAAKYSSIKSYLQLSDIEYEDYVVDPILSPFFDFQFELREYQEQAVDRWMEDKKGVIVLPTGSGKTYVALEIVKEMNVPALIVVPTLDLVDQWKEVIPFDCGELTGREKDLKAITLATYDSAHLNADSIGNKFLLLVFDEVHHLPSKSYRSIAEMSAAPYRLGLTATYEREDGEHKLLPELVGGKIFEISPQDLSGTHLANYVLNRISVPLTEEETDIYDKNIKVFRNYIASHNIKLRSPEDFRKVVMRTGFDEKAYEALKAWDNARKIAFNSKNKIKKLKELLEEHKMDKIIIFTRHNDLVYNISKLFLIPAITYRTKKEERKSILTGFRRGTYRAIVSSQVLDEGVDVPDANVGIIMSGSGSAREFIQRLGRILRPNKEKAILYELVSLDTSEVQTSRRRSPQVKSNASQGVSGSKKVQR